MEWATYVLPETHIWPLVFGCIALYALGRWVGGAR